MNYQITRSHEVGQADHGWLKAKHYFSFASYHNPERMSFGSLRVINDDTIAPDSGFGTHPHRDMEIITIPLAGAVSHEDSVGNKGSITKGEVQVMSAGTGVLHSEFNHSKSDELSLFQIWIEPNKTGVSPRYGQEKFDYHTKSNQWTQMISPMDIPAEEGLKIHQDAYINASLVKAKASIGYQSKADSHGLFVLVASGAVELNGETLQSRDSMEISDSQEIEIKANTDSEVIIIEVPLTNS